MAISDVTAGTELHQWKFNMDARCEYHLCRIFSIKPNKVIDRDDDGIGRYVDDWSNRRIGYSPIDEPSKRYFVNEEEIDVSLANPGGAIKIAVTTSPDEMLAKAIFVADLERSVARYETMIDSLKGQIEKMRSDAP